MLNLTLIIYSKSILVPLLRKLEETQRINYHSLMEKKEITKRIVTPSPLLISFQGNLKWILLSSKCITLNQWMTSTLAKMHKIQDNHSLLNKE